jgi:antitoxin PrlF
MLRTRTIMIAGKVTPKVQTTIPHPVRAALQIRPDGELTSEVVEPRVILAQAKRGGKTDDLFRTFSEWDAEADTKACGSVLAS